MSEIDSVVVAPVALAAIGALVKGVHWIGKLWETISRERIDAERKNAELDRANNTRIADQHATELRHLAERVDDHTARDIGALNALTNAVGQMSSQINTIANIKDSTPVPGFEERPMSERRAKPRMGHGKHG